MASGTGLAPTSDARACWCSGSTGSSTNSGRNGASSGSTRRAVAGVNRPWQSMAMSRSGPRAARAVAARATTASTSAELAIGDMRPHAFIFTAVNPASTCAAIASASSVGSSPPTQAYTRTRSRTGPPSNAYTGAS